MTETFVRRPDVKYRLNRVERVIEDTRTPVEPHEKGGRVFEPRKSSPGRIAYHALRVAARKVKRHAPAAAMHAVHEAGRHS